MLVSFFVVATVAAENWPGWRGPRGDGTSRERSIPGRWDGPSGRNIRWKIEVPGTGHGSPIVWGERIFLVSCLQQSGARILFCFDRAGGEERWRRTVLTAPLETRHRLNSAASSTPATDGELVVTAFLEVDGSTVPAPNVSGSREVTPGKVLVTAYDFAGERRWQTNAGAFVSAHGFASNPVLFEDLVIINGDHDGDSYIVALERRSGEVRWRVPRDHRTRSYVTPIIRELAGRTQMVLSGSHSVASYDPRTGARHWFMDGPTEQFVASMVDDGERVFLTAGYPDHHIVAIRADGTGNVTDSHIAWRTSRGAAYVPSPIVAGGCFLVVSDGGVASCFESASGTRFWMERIGPRYSASLVAAGGHVYFLSDRGVTTVVRPGAEFERVAENALGEDCYASPALSDGMMFIRAERHLYCIAEKAESAQGDKTAENESDGGRASPSQEPSLPYTGPNRESPNRERRES